MAKRNLWLDDLRQAPDDWLWAKNFDEAIAILIAEDIDFASLDHDLGYCAICTEAQSSHVFDDYRCSCRKTGYDVVKWMEENDKWPSQKPKVHSMNPVGRHNMQLVINRKYDRTDE